MNADYCFVNGKVVNVYSGEILNHNVAVAGDRILYVGPPQGDISSNTRIIDVKGDYILPGFFDGHAHADLYYNPFAYANFVLARGTTGFFNDGHDLANGLGAEPFLKIMTTLSKGPLSVYTGVPAASSPPYPEVEGGELWSQADLENAMTYENVLSISEVTPYLRVVKGDAVLEKRLGIAKRHGKLIEGHTTGSNIEKLNVLAAAGVTSCHESLNSEDVLNRIRLGYYVMLRHGSIRKDLPELIPAIEQLKAFDTSRLMLVSDGIFPDHLVAWGNMDWVVSEAVQLGIEPVRAVQMATINPARYFKLDHLLGGIAPGRIANLLVAPSLQKPTPRLVMAKGALVAEDNQLIIPPQTCPVTDLGARPITFTSIGEDVFKVPSRKALDTVPVIRIVNQTVTDREDRKIPVQDSIYRPEDDVLMAVFISRDGKKVGRGFVSGYCAGLGGIASTHAHDTHGLLVVGQRFKDMALAANDVLKMEGGVSLAHGGEVKARIPLPIGGIASKREIPELANEIIEMNQVLGDLGSALDNPLWTLVFLSFTSVLQLRITYSGVYDVRKGKIIF